MPASPRCVLALAAVLACQCGCATGYVREEYARTWRTFVPGPTVYVNPARDVIALPGVVEEEDHVPVPGLVAYEDFVISERGLGRGRVVYGETLPIGFTELRLPVCDAAYAVYQQDIDSEPGRLAMDGIFAQAPDTGCVRLFLARDRIHFVWRTTWSGERGPDRSYSVQELSYADNCVSSHVRWYRYPDLGVMYVLAFAADLVLVPLIVITAPFNPLSGFH